ncbi:sensor histidine kinase [Bradyrhizobium sp.]|uniref:sensor histidine kinase n=1 Tax=Bradyrhizobium sp. TaxID=376 RepID=UPI0025C12B4E|nr:sensor histidine kinase [Bradyrhizobium sp.]
MALHELTTNATKYGALSNRDGRLNIDWTVTAAPEPAFSMQWRESGGPEVVVPSRKGFGHKVIGRMAEAAVDGSVEIDYAKNGLCWKITAPAANILEGASVPPPISRE